jgi:signal peptidase I
MKGYDLMKGVTENPEKYEGRRYKIKRGATIDFNGQNYYGVVVRDGRIYPRDMDYHAYFNIISELEEIPKLPEPVDFMTAANSRRRIKPLHPHKDANNNYYTLILWLYWFARERDNGIYNSQNALEYMNGQWVVEPEGLEGA